MNLAALPESRAERDPRGACLSDDDIAYDNAEFDQAVRRAATALSSRGVRPGDVVAVMLPNTSALVVVLFAAWRLGATVTPVNPALLPDEAAYQISDADVRVLVVDKQVGSAIPASDVAVLTVGELPEHPPTEAPVASLCGDELALLVYTSGTTGRPKGVMLDHANVAAMCQMMIQAMRLTAADHSLLVLPLFHANGIMAGTLSPLLAGGQVTVAGRFSPKTFFDRVERSRSTYFSAVPAIYTLLTDLPVEVRPDTSSVRFGVCGAAPASVELLERFEKRYGIPLIEGYGLSEATCASTINPLDGVRKPGTVGVALPGQQVRVVAADGNALPAGQAGEVLIAGPTVMRGYLNRPGETAKTIVDGWLHTGDIGRLDDDGYLTLVDRAKDMIIRGGENIYPKEIEAVIYRLPEIAEAAVVGRESAVYGEEPVLFVALNNGAQLSTDAIARHARENLTKHKLPVDITICDELPKNPVGKIDKPALRRLLQAAVHSA